MGNNNLNDVYLAKWLSGELTPDQLEEFKQHPHYNQYVKINDAALNMSLTDYDVDHAYLNLKTKINNGKHTSNTKVISLYKWVGAVAACMLICVGVYVFSFSSNIYESNLAEKRNVVLPDGSTVMLNSKAVAEVNTFNWKTSRLVELEGEAFFKVKKGNKFSVETAVGTVQVLGTQFTVNTINNNLLVVKCFEGKVQVKTPIKEVILTKGMAFQVFENTITEWNFEQSQPSWIATDNESRFNSMPIGHVLTSLKRQFDIKISNAENINKNLIFSGSFSNKNMEKALYTVFSTLGVKYEFVSDKEIRILHPIE
ncbi:FecR family protein [Aquimarina agarivorans]|uniref:FecR family protein n=1 Tax=Aquimarina agarivorans TaxID=980584 RepID=UPI000248E833|nr:FecR family protein [Aquimarina agarivorans]